MKFIHPCKHCIARPVCTNECNILKEYAKKIDILSNDSIFTTIFSFACLYEIVLCILIYLFIPWSLSLVPFIWGGSYYLTIYLFDDTLWNKDKPMESLLTMLCAPAIAFMAMVLNGVERYLNKYGPGGY